MRIVHTEASCGWGGQEIRILNEAQGMMARGHRVHLVCPAEARIATEAARFQVPVSALPIGKKTLSALWQIRAWIVAEISRHGVDVINTHSSTDSWLSALALATLKHPPALVRTRHISAPVSNNFATRWLYRDASRFVVTTGAALRQALIDENHFDGDRIVSIPTGIDGDYFRPPNVAQRDQARALLGVSAGTFVVGIVATLRSWKGHRYLIEAAVRCVGRGCEDLCLVVVGDGPQRADLEERARNCGLGSRIVFCGNQIDVLPWLDGFDAFVLPSYANEGVPQALLQAMSCALPVVTTSVGAIGEIARDGQTALVVPAKDPDALAEALQRIHTDREAARQLGLRARELVRAHHQLGGMLTQMEEVFERALDSGAGFSTPTCEDR